ncbi:hypothetical protein SERLA73DRAFT_65156, partial [Serpula lacrymans var. lacrymans S7.3]
CAILSTHNLPHIQHHASNDILWQTMSWCLYWEKNIWIIPIHPPSLVEHWVLCIAHLSTKQLHLFDSFGDQKGWKVDIKVSGLSCICHH